MTNMGVECPLARAVRPSRLLFELKYDEFRGLRLTPQANYFTLLKMMTSV